MFFIRNEIKKRHEGIDRAIADFYDLLDKNDHQNGLIGTDTSQFYRQNLDLLVIPNVRHGVMKIGKRALIDENFIPIWSMRPGEELITENELRLPSPRQYEKLSQVRDFQERLKEWQQSETPPIAINKEDEAKLSVGTFHISVEPEAEYAYGRPALILNHNYRKSSSHRPDTIAHEIVHNEQFTAEPLVAFDSEASRDNLILQKEIAAYRAQFPVLSELYRQGLYSKRSLRYSYEELDHIEKLTKDATFDTRGYISLGDGYREKLIQRLAERGLDNIAPGLNDPANSQPPHAPEPAANNPQ